MTDESIKRQADSEEPIYLSPEAKAEILKLRDPNFETEAEHNQILLNAMTEAIGCMRYNGIKEDEIDSILYCLERYKVITEALMIEDK